jgi:hypothetical protein
MATYTGLAEILDASGETIAYTAVELMTQGRGWGGTAARGHTDAGRRRWKELYDQGTAVTIRLATGETGKAIVVRLSGDPRDPVRLRGTGPRPF